MDGAGTRLLTLANGLRVVLSADRTFPACAIHVAYRAGSRDDAPGRTGLAHLFEHIMFQGSENAGPGEHAALCHECGGTVNADTTPDRSAFFQQLPAEYLEMGLILEADRMRSLEVTAAGLEVQRLIVQEERRLVLDNRPYGRTGEALMAAAFSRFVNAHSFYGSSDDLASISVGDVEAFRAAYYGPNNAVLTLTGRFDEEEALALVRRHFEPIEPRPRPPMPDLTEPPRSGERRGSIVDAFAPRPRLDIGYSLPSAFSPDWLALRVLWELLAGGESSRLQRRVGRSFGAGVRVSSALQQILEPSLGSFAAAADTAAALPDIEAAILEELEETRRSTPERADVDGACSRIRHAWTLWLSEEPMLRRAMRLGDAALLRGDPASFHASVGGLALVRPEDVRRVAERFLRPENRAVLATLPASAAETAARVHAPPGRPPTPRPPAETARKGRVRLPGREARPEFPSVLRAVLGNGLTVLALEDRRLPIARVRVEIPGAGSLHDPPEAPGLAQIAARLLQEEAPDRRELETLGAAVAFSAPAGSGAAAAEASGPAATLHDWLPRVLGAIARPALSEAGLAAVKERAAAEARGRRSSSAFLANELLRRALFGLHPAACSDPSDEDLRAMRLAMIKEWHRERCGAERAALAIVGDFRAGELLERLAAEADGWPRGDSRPRPVPAPEPLCDGAISLADRPGSAQATVALGCRAVGREDELYLPLLVMNRVLGDGPASRLFKSLREGRGLTYKIQSGLTAETGYGWWSASCDVSNGAAGDVAGELLNELRRMREEPVPEPELASARRSLAGQFALSLERPARVIEHVLARERHGLPAACWDEYPERILAVTAADVLRAASARLGEPRLVAVGDARLARPGLERHGPVAERRA